jgi:hypothetical protein
MFFRGFLSSGRTIGFILQYCITTILVSALEYSAYKSCQWSLGRTQTLTGQLFKGNLEALQLKLEEYAEE